MVQSTSIALFASVALFAASPAFGAVLPSSKIASTTTTVARTTATTTSSGVTKPTPDTSRKAQEMKLFKELAQLEGFDQTNGKAALQNLKKDIKSASSTASSSSSSATPTGKLLSGKPTDRLAEKARLDKLRDQKYRLAEQNERLKMSKLNKEISEERLRIGNMDRERLSFENRLARPARPTGSGVTTFGSAPTPAALNLDRLGKPLNGKPQPASITGSVTQTTTTALPTKSVQPSRQNSANREKDEERRIFADLERLVEGDKAPREVEEVQWVRGYDNSENDARDYDDEDVFAREDDEDVFARDFDDEEAFSREDLEDLEFALRELDNDEDVYSRFDFEGLEDLD